MFCPNCGTQNSDTAKFCSSCGTALGAAQTLPLPNQPFQTAQGYAAPPGPAVSDGLKIGIAIVSFFVPLVGIIMGLVYLNDANPEKKRAGKLWLMISLGVIVLGFLSCCFFGSLGGLIDGLKGRYL